MRAFHDPDNNHLVAEGHHYLSESLIAKLYKTDGKNADGDPVFKAINQSLNAFIYFRHRPTDLDSQYNHQPLVILNYPIIVCNSFEKFLKKDTTNDSEDSIIDTFQLEVDYAYTVKDKELEELFYIDVLDIEKFGIFENDILQKEIELARQKSSDDRR